MVSSRRCDRVHVTHELLRRGAVEERAYQVNIAKACLGRSTLVVVPTGMGKTVIAAMVIAETLRRRGGRILFLAPTKPLVEQHAASLKEILTVERIALFTGEATSPEERELLWRENKVIVSTPQVIRNDLRAGRFGLEEVSLIVFDEAHRAVGNYAYVDVAAAYKEVRDRLGRLSLLKKKYGVNAGVKVTGTERRLTPETQLLLFRIAQEALSNIRRHAEASAAGITLEFSEGKVRMTVEDNGKGFKVPDTLSHLASAGKLGGIVDHDQGCVHRSLRRHARA